ncbi:hypothetical protein MKX01_009887 [Papaver californicum]|nr:hypothetical protein MKX01_009887 [Papaver californicum]
MSEIRTETTKPTATTSTTNVTDHTIPTPTVYKDNWFDRLAIKHISQSIQAITGMKNDKSSYDSFVEASATVIQISKDTKMQQELVIQSLNKAFSKRILYLIKVLIPESKFKREFFATFTTLFFAWLVGPCRAKEYEIEGKMEKNVVHIPKCMFLEESKCVGMYVNLCKMPWQKLIKDSFRTPIYMKPSKHNWIIYFIHSL